jgi:hypothetical protein
MKDERDPVLTEAGLSTAQRMLWIVCIAVYLTVFIGGIQSGGAELMAMGRAVAFTLAAAVLGKVAIGLLGQASLPAEEGPSADEPGRVGSLVELVSSANVAHHEDRADAA